MPTYLNAEQLTQLLKVSNYIKINHPTSTTKSTNSLFKSYLEYVIDKGIDIDYSLLPKNTHKGILYNEQFAHHELAMELIPVIKDKIEVFSDQFWSLFDYSKNYNKAAWKDNVTQYYLGSSDYKQRNDYIKNLMETTKDQHNPLDIIENYISHVNYPESTHIRWWYDLINSKTNKDKKANLLEREVPNFLKKITPSDSKDIILQVKCISLFEKDCAIEEITKIYENHKHSLLEPKLFSYLSALNGSVKSDYVDLYEEKKSITYTTEFTVDPLYYTQQYNLSESKIKNFFTIIDYYLKENLNNTGINFKVEADPYYLLGSKNTQAKKHIVFSSLDNERLEQEMKSFKVDFKNMNRYFCQLYHNQLSEKSMTEGYYKDSIKQVNNYIEKLELYEKLDSNVNIKKAPINNKNKI